MATAPGSTHTEKGIIGRSFEQGAPVIWSFVDELPNQQARQVKPWLTVVSWQYDGSGNDGMPGVDLQELMQELERALYPLEESAFSLAAYRRTGNGLKEFSYYVEDRALFMARLNELLAGHPKYPLEIKFFEDPTWSDFEKLAADFRQPNTSVQRTASPPADL